MGFLSTLRRDLQGGTDAYKDFVEQRGDWVAQQLAASGLSNPIGWQPTGEGGGENVYNYTPEMQAKLNSITPGWEMGGDSGGWMVNPEYAAMERQFQDQLWQQQQAYVQKEKQLTADWITTLPPEQQAKAAQEFSLHSSDMDTINKYGSMVAKGIIAASGAGAALTGAGLLGGAAGTPTAGAIESAAGIPELGLAPQTGLSASGAEAGLGYGGYGGAGGTVAGQGGMLGGTSVASGASPLGGAGVDIATAAGSLPGAGSIPDALKGALTQGGKSMADLGISDYLKLAGTLAPTIAGIATSPSGSPPAGPDYTKLAELQAELDRKNVDYTNQQNRINQYNPYGSLEYSIDPVTGKQIQTEKFSPQMQALFDQQNKARLEMGDIGMGMMGGVRESVKDPFNLEGIQGLADPGFGNVSEVQKAMMGLMQPGLDQQRAREIQRLKAQGLTEGSRVMQDTQRAHAGAQSDAELKALLAGTSEYNTIFNRTGVARNQGIRDRLLERQTPLNELNSFLTGQQIQNPSFENFNNAMPSQTPQVYKAASDQYANTLGNWNAKQAQQQNTSQGLFKLGGTLGNIFYG